MQISVAKKQLAEIDADALIVHLFEGEEELSGPVLELDEAMGGAIKALFSQGDFIGKDTETALLYPNGRLPLKRIVLAGVGKAADLSPERLRKAIACAGQTAHRKDSRRLAVLVLSHEKSPLPLETVAQAEVEGVLMGLHYPIFQKTTPPKHPPMTEAVFLYQDDPQEGEVKAGVETGQIFSDAACTARDLVNQPANLLTPSLLADAALAMAVKDGLSCRVLDKGEMKRLGMGALLGVAGGSVEPPKFIIMEHGASQDEGRGEQADVVLIGKGITFDSGGLSLKPNQSMETMKTDMGGAAAVMAAMQGVARLKLPLRVTALIPAAENLPSGTALKPGDVVKAMNGKTIEVINTDAEGRLLLADALSYAKRYQPKVVVDVATLTGACVVALGEEVAAGLFATDDDHARTLIQAGEFNGERLWRLPLFEEYGEKIKSEVADMKNAGGRYGGVGVSAHFLKSFVSYPWVHIDMAGVCQAKKRSSYIHKGATGFAARTLLTWLKERANGAT